MNCIYYIISVLKNQQKYIVTLSESDKENLSIRNIYKINDLEFGNITEIESDEIVNIIKKLDLSKQTWIQTSLDIYGITNQMNLYWLKNKIPTRSILKYTYNYKVKFS